ncbi:cupin domain-containing protein [Sulfitobacter sp.]|uniref:cupin domain-containing protein n=1 Tax=Sulfitobacter sp. TaxID=1903071 RepID=UPI003003850F
MKPVNLTDKLSKISTHWDPHVIADYNDNDVMVVKFIGEFPFHLHEDTDDFFLVLKGEMTMDVEDTSHIVKEGELFIVPRGVTHRPRASEECHVLLIEPKGTPNSGDPATASSKPRL